MLAVLLFDGNVIYFVYYQYQLLLIISVYTFSAQIERSQSMTMWMHVAVRVKMCKLSLYGQSYLTIEFWGALQCSLVKHLFTLIEHLSMQ